ncbi:helix-turn-helix domain-containing protein [Parasphingorhabdus sp. DH2-15]|uniref:helix-turn-helix domain-containing protein n=1 Tax=Parasphingorhabdus sp. DH2-15 TaxID=3444112 RepID=UPI003F683780
MEDEEPANEELMLLTVGERLQEARKAKQLSLEDISNSTRISSRHLQSLEENRFSDMPGRTYTIGFARAYAKVVGLPESEWLDPLREELDADQNKRQAFALPDSNIEESGKVPSAKTAWIIAAVGIVAVVLGYAAWRGTSGFSDMPELASAEDTAGDAGLLDGSGQEGGDDSTAGDEGSIGDDPANIGPDAPVIFTATQDRIWVKFYDANGDQLMQKEMKLGETYTVPADAEGPQLATARPDALSITVGGRVIEPLGTAERVIRDVPVDPLALLNRADSAEQ